MRWVEFSVRLCRPMPFALFPHRGSSDRLGRIYASSVAATLVLILLLWLGAGWSISESHRTAVRFAFLQADSASQKLAERTARLLERVDQTATMVKFLQERDGMVDLKRLEREGLLVDPATLPAVHLLDAHGRVVASTLPGLDVQLGDRAYFRAVQHSGDDRLVVAAPVQSRARQQWVLPAAKRVLAPDGSFAGAVVVSFDPIVLTRGFTLHGHPDALVGVIGEDGLYRARSSGSSHSIGVSIPRERLQQATRIEQRQLAPVVSPIDGIARFNSAAPVGRHGLYAVVAVPESTALTEHLSVRRQILAIALLSSLGIVACAIFLTRQAVRIARTTQARTLAEVRLFNEKELLHVTLRSIGDGVITSDAEGRLTYLNPSAEDMTGWPTGEAAGRPAGEVLRMVDAEGASCGDPLDQVLHERRPATGGTELAVLSRSGMQRPVEHSAAPIFDREGALLGAVMVLHDVTRARRLAQQLSWQASHDALTNLLNRTAFEERLDASIEAAASQGRQHVLMFLDLDQFKIVNDSCGHIAGDELLKQLSHVLSTQVRKDDTLARLGGDEFALLLKDCPLPAALRAADAVRQQVRDFHFVWQDKKFQLGVSIGAVAIHDGRHSRTDLLRMADTACYLAKDNGRNRIHVYDDADHVVVQRQGEIDWASRLQNALSENRFLLEGQRIEPLRESEAGMAGYEILIRLRDENGRVVPPMAFLPAAERYGLMAGIDKWVIDKALALHAACRGKWPAATRFSINLSGVTLCDPTLVEYITGKLAEHRVPATAICFEVTETAAIANLGIAVDLIHRLRRLGCRFALDDFGSGMSSFAYLKQLPVDYVKIDGGFVKDMLDDPVDYAMVEAIHNIAQRMGLKTVAEFVENAQTIEALRALGVDYVQGYGVERPRALDKPGG